MSNNHDVKNSAMGNGDAGSSVKGDKEQKQVSPEIQLGVDSLYVDQYKPSLLAPIPRASSRDALFGTDALPFKGRDVWTAYELSWINEKGKPEVAIAEFEFAFDTECIVESKSFKYYLNSFNQSVFASGEQVLKTLKEDLSQAARGEVDVRMYALDDFHPVDSFEGSCVDRLDVEITNYSDAEGILKVSGEKVVSCMRLYSHLLKSNCPVTGQPDWATVWVEYSGAEIEPESFLKYIVAYRNHQDFHENCVEKIFADITRQCAPSMLTVYARYTRRGGLDINPYRSSWNDSPGIVRLARQ